MRRKILLGCGLMAAIAVVSIAVGVHGCKNEHSRPQGQGDITISVSPNGKFLVFNGVGQGGRDLYILDIGKGIVSRIAATQEYEVDPSFSPDGKSIAYAAGAPGDRADHLTIRDLTTGKVQQVTSDDANVSTPSFFPGGKRIVYARDTDYHWGGLAASWNGGGAMMSVNAAGGAQTRLLPQIACAIAPQVSPDGKTLLWWNQDGIFTAPLNIAAAPRKVTAGHVRDPAWSPNGKQIVYTEGEYSPDTQLCVISASGGTPITLPQAGKGCSHPVFGPNGKTIYYLMESWPSGPTGAQKHSLWMLAAAGAQPKRIANYDLFDRPMEWKP